MEDLKTVAVLARWAADDTIHQLQFIPEDRLDWSPAEEIKSALKIVGEIVMVLRMMQPAFEGGACVGGEFPLFRSREEAVTALREATEKYAAALEAAGPELERMLETPVGPLWGPRAVLFPAIELLHHHGQITYIQSLLGDHEFH